MNRSYSPKGKIRDNNIENICTKNSITFHTFQDFLLVEPDECEQRKVFTPYSMLWKKFLMAHPERLQMLVFDGTQTKWFVPDDRQEIESAIPVAYHPLWTMEFGRSRLQRSFSSYDDLRNIPSIDGSTRLSPYIRFGIFSIREIYQKFVPKSSLQRGYREEGGDLDPLPLDKGGWGDLVSEKNPQSLRDSSFGKELTETLLNELIWREFWYQIASYFPFTYELEFQERRRSIVWKTDATSYEYEKFEK